MEDKKMIYVPKMEIGGLVIWPAHRRLHLDVS